MGHPSETSGKPRGGRRSPDPPGRPLALVTGGGRRLGRRIALALARAGYDLAFSYHESVAAAQSVALELEALGVRATPLAADLRDAAQAQALAQRAEREAGAVALLVNSAAVFPRSDAETPDASVFDETIALNLRAPYLLSLECGRAMRERGHGAIVNIASVGGLRPYANHIPYSLSKAGVVMLTRVTALVLAPQVRVNAVAPGTIWLDGEEEGAAAKPDAETIPLQAYGSSADIEQAVLYLARAPFITGEVLVVDGGAVSASNIPERRSRGRGRGVVAHEFGKIP